MADKASSWLDSTAGIKAHDVSSGPGKFNDAFMGTGVNDDKQTPKSTQPSGSYPLTEKSDPGFAKPTHAPETLIPKK